MLAMKLLNHRFLFIRNFFMDKFGFNRRVATLAARCWLGVDTFEIIATTPNFNGRHLLTPEEARMIINAFEKLGD